MCWGNVVSRPATGLPAQTLSLVVLAGSLCTGCCSSWCTTWRSASSEPLGHCRGTWWLPMLLAPCRFSPSCSWGALSFPRRPSTPGWCGCTGSTPCSGLKELSPLMSSVHHAGVPWDPKSSRSDLSPTSTGACINSSKGGKLVSPLSRTTAFSLPSCSVLALQAPELKDFS